MIDRYACVRVFNTRVKYLIKSTPRVAMHSPQPGLGGGINSSSFRPSSSSSSRGGVAFDAGGVTNPGTVSSGAETLDEARFEG